MKYHLSFNNNEHQITLPVNPAAFGVARDTNNTRVDINNMGTINLIGKVGLRECTIESFFPNNRYTFLRSPLSYSPKDCVNMVEYWQESGRPIRLVVTGTKLNQAFVIDNFEYTWQDGTGDIYYILVLSEYRFQNQNLNTKADIPQTSRLLVAPAVRESSGIAKKHIVTAQEAVGSFFSLASSLTGMSGNAYAIMAKNNITDPTALKEGQILNIGDYT